MTQTTATRTSEQPGWPEILVGLAAMAVVGYAFPILVLRQIDMGVATGGIVSAFLSGAAGLAGYAAARAVRRRGTPVDWGIRRTTGRWLLIGVAGGIVALIAKIALVPAFVALTGVETDTQEGYAAGASGGPLLLVLTAIGLVLLTPIGEEFLFRGVVTSGLLRYGPVVATLGSSVVFALAHGINFVLPSAFIAGVIAAELRRRSGSVWPGVVVHAVNNAISVATYAVLPAVT